jgi:vacuolar-type H+-ATPase subunit H
MQTAAPDVERAEFAGSMVAFEARTTGTFAQGESLALIAETTRANGQITSESLSEGADSTARDEVERIVAEAREEAEAIKAEAEEEAEQRAAKVIARAREEADQVRETVATLTAQADDARSAALRSKLEAEDLAEAQKAMSEARDQIIATAEGRAEEITQDAERIAAELRAEATAALDRARAEADRIVSSAAQEAREEKAATPLPVEAGAGSEPIVAPEPIVEPQTDRAGSTETEALEPQQAGSGDELAALLAEAEQDLVANDKLRQERARLDAQEAELAAHRAEAILLAATRDGSAVDDDATDTAGADVEFGAQELEVQGEPAETSSEPAALEAPVGPTEGDTARDTAVDPPAQRVEFNDILDMQDEAASSVGADDDGHQDDEEEEDPADLLTALLDKVAPQEGSDDSDDVLGSNDAEPAAAPDAVEEAIEDLSEETRPRVAWPSPVDLDREPDERIGDGERQSRYRSRSARLPRLGRQADSNLTTMANLRKKSRSSEDD